MNLYRWLIINGFFWFDRRTSGTGRSSGAHLAGSRDALGLNTLRSPPALLVEAVRVGRLGLLRQMLQRVRRRGTQPKPQPIQELRLLWIALVMAVTSFALSMLIATLSF